MSHFFRLVLLFGIFLSLSFPSQAMLLNARKLAKNANYSSHVRAARWADKDIYFRTKVHSISLGKVLRLHAQKKIDDRIYALATSANMNLYLRVIKASDDVSQQEEQDFLLKANLLEADSDFENDMKATLDSKVPNKDAKELLIRWLLMLVQEYKIIKKAEDIMLKHYRDKNIVIDDTAKEKRDLIIDLNNTGTTQITKSYFPLKEAKTLELGEKAESTDSILSISLGLWDFAVALFDPVSKRALLSSFKLRDDLASLIPDIIDEFRKDSPEGHIEIHLAGGHEKYINNMYAMLKILMRMPGVEIKTARIDLPFPIESHRLAIDPKTGEVHKSAL